MYRSLLKNILLLVVLCSMILMSACGAKSPKEDAKTFDKQALVIELQSQIFFKEAKEPSAADLTDLYGIDTTLLKDSILLVDKEYNLCMMVIPAEGKSNDVKNMMSKSLDNLAQQLEMYQPQQCQQVKNRMETMRGEYLVYLATPDDETTLSVITKAIEG